METCPALVRMPRRKRWGTLALSAWLLGMTSAHADPLAGLAAGEQKSVRSFLARSSLPQPGSTDVIELRRADLDADGRDELVMLWGLFGASSAWPSLTVFRRGRHDWQEAGTHDLPGPVAQRMDVQGREILLETGVPAAEEPRCCPSRRLLSRYRWEGQRLVGGPMRGTALR